MTKELVALDRAQYLCRERSAFAEFFLDHAGFYRDVDLEHGGHVAPMHRDLDVLRVDGQVLGDGVEHFLVKHRDEIGLIGRFPLMRQKDLQPLARHRRSRAPIEKSEEAHAALRPKSLRSRLV